MDLRDYIRVLRKGWATVLAFVILGIGAGVALTLATTKKYEATAVLYVFVPGGSSDANLQQGSNYAIQQVQTLITFATADSVVNQVADTYNKGRPAADQIKASDLADEITADAPLSKTLINVHVTDTDPARAAVLANAVATAFSQTAMAATVADTGTTASTSPSASASGTAPSTSTSAPVINVRTAHVAKVPDSPVKPDKLLNIGLGFAVGLLLGIGVVILREVLDNTVKGPSDFEEIGLPVLGLVPFDKRTPRSPIAFRTDPHSARSEAYRQVRTNLQFVDVDNPPRIIAVTSAVPGEGKTTTAINLASALAEAGSRVCLIEADLRRPSIAKALGLVGDVGFTTVVIGKAPVETVLQNAGRNLAVLTSGPIPPNPSELLISQHAKNVILDLAKQVDFVIVDTPPLLPVTDSAELATLTDATLLVHRAGKTTREQALRSIEALEKVGRHPVGVILNMITRGSGKYDYEYAYYYTPYRPDRSNGKRGAHHNDSSNDVAVEPVSVSDSSEQDTVEVLGDPAASSRGSNQG